MAKDVLVNAGVGEVRVAVLDGRRARSAVAGTHDRLEDGGKRTGAGNGGRRNLVGDIFLGRVQRVLPCHAGRLHQYRAGAGGVPGGARGAAAHRDLP